MINTGADAWPSAKALGMISLANERKRKSERSMRSVPQELSTIEQSTENVLDMHPRQGVDAQVSQISDNETAVRYSSGEAERAVSTVSDGVVVGRKYDSGSLPRQSSSTRNLVPRVQHGFGKVRRSELYVAR